MRAGVARGLSWKNSEGLRRCRASFEIESDESQKASTFHFPDYGFPVGPRRGVSRLRDSSFQITLSPSTRDSGGEFTDYRLQITDSALNPEKGRWRRADSSLQIPEPPFEVRIGI